MTTVLPHSARLAWTITAWLQGLASGDAVLEELEDPDLVVQVSDVEGQQIGPTDLLLLLRRTGVLGAGLALPVEGDPVGLGGPAPFNGAAMEAGEAVLVGHLGLVPSVDGGLLRWDLHPAARRQLVDVGEADPTLRRAVQVAARRLADLDVARWRPEVADELMALTRATHLDAPAVVPELCRSLAQRALQAQAIVELALADDGAAVSAGEAAARRDALTPLAAAARRALVAACSYEVWPPARD
ncbi:MAG: hypothetical protein ACI379_02625 [Nocardioides sp.]|uniref:hypothetical protein n=1 Tax=Nocardioides sp. TaxID=35761 RepID=UPI003F009FCB